MRVAATDCCGSRPSITKGIHSLGSERSSLQCTHKGRQLLQLAMALTQESDVSGVHAALMWAAWRRNSVVLTRPFWKGAPELQAAFK